MGLVYVILALALLAVIGAIWGLVRIEIYRRRRIYPQKGQETMDDVKRLALKGNTSLAINAYRALHHVGLKKAKDEVEKIKAD